jgi:hypothetical protein
MNVRFRLLALTAVVMGAGACGDVIRDSKGPSVLVINALQGASGGGFGANQFGSTLHSDVLVLVTSPAPCTRDAPCPTVYSDQGRATMSLAPKNTTVAPTSNNQVTISRYTVTFRRNDGRNTPGLDVPYPLDGAVTVTIPPSGTADVPFELVRHVAKQESPLAQLVTNKNIITAIADVTFYGKDLVGNAVTASGSLLVDFGNFGDQ